MEKQTTNQNSNFKLILLLTYIFNKLEQSTNQSFTDFKIKNKESDLDITIDDENINLTKDQTNNQKYQEVKDESVGEIQYEDSPHGTFKSSTSWFLRLFFVHLVRMNLKLNKTIKLFKHMTFRDVPNVDKELKVEENSINLSQKMNECCSQNNSPLTSLQFFKIIIKQYRGKILTVFFFLLSDALVKIISSIALQNVIWSIQNSQDVVLSAFKYISLQVLSIMLMHQGGQKSQELSTLIRMCLISTLFKKINSLSYYSIKSANLSKCFNLISTNIQQIEAKFPFYFQSFVSVISFCICALILYQRHGYSGILTIILLISIIPIQNALSKKGTYFLVKKTQFSDKRVSITNEILEGIKLIKMYAWEKAFCKFVEVVRSDEIKEFLQYTSYNLISITLSACSAISGSFFAFIVSYYFSEEGDFQLSSSKMFSTISLLFYIRVEALLFFSFGLNLFHEQKVFAERYLSIINIQNIDMKQIEYQDTFDGKQQQLFTDFSDQKEINQKFIKQIYNREQQNNTENNQAKVILQNFSAWWNSQNISKPVISNLSINLKPCSFNALIGKNGSGKTSLLYSLIKETPVYNGIYEVEGSIAFCGQEPCILEGTVRENITFGKPYIKQWYDKVIQDCQLVTDLQLLQFGDQTEIGDKGVNLSGGQRSRIALARAVYSNADIYILDDPLSAVDSRVAKQLIEIVFKKTLKDKIIIMSTHLISFVFSFDHIIIMEDGQISNQGSPNDLSQNLKNLSTDSYSLEVKAKQNELQKQKTLEDLEEEYNEEIEKNSNKEEEKNKQGSECRIQIENKDRKIVTSAYEPISFHVYKRYFQYIPKYKIIISLLLFAMNDVIITVFNRCISYFDDVTFNRNWLFFILGVLTFAYICVTWKKLNVVYKIVNECNAQLHSNMLKGLLNTSISFFEERNKGQILNKFTNDLGSLDFLNSQISDVLERSLSLLTYISIIIITQPYFLLVGFLQTIILIKLLKFSSALIQHSKSLYSKSKSPVFSFLSSILSSMEIIRVFKQNDYFQRKFDKICNLNIRCNLLFLFETRVFTILIQYTTSFTSILGLLLIITFSDRKSPMIGQSVLCIYLMSDIMSWALRQIVNMENSMSSVQDILELCDLQSEEDKEQVQNSQSFINEIQNREWPQSGEVQFKNVHLRYKEGQEYSLKGINFTINPKEKVGCIGRTGAGKSSIIETLFRMRDKENKNNIDLLTKKKIVQSIEYDGLNIYQVPLHQIRSNISIIPQTPFLFIGTIRRNLDPLDEYSDQQILDVLKEVNLYDTVMKCKYQLQTDMTDVNSVFSFGQKQLICLARALLKKSQLIIMDEATSNIDQLTDCLIQNVIQKNMRNCSVLTIAHRLNTIANYDKIVVLDKGKVLESGHPYLLLVNDINDSEITSNSLFSTYVHHSGEENSKIIYQIARKNYFSQNNEYDDKNK